jgi:hypothetical protein
MRGRRGVVQYPIRNPLTSCFAVDCIELHRFCEILAASEITHPAHPESTLATHEKANTFFEPPWNRNALDELLHELLECLPRVGRSFKRLFERTHQ